MPGAFRYEMIVSIEDQGQRANHRAVFSAFVTEVEPRLRRALAGAVGIDAAHDATAEALSWAWERWGEVSLMANPAGYLYRVARSSTRVRQPKRVRYLVDEPNELPHIEPALPDALRALPERQRSVVWLVYACEWTYKEVGDALGISASAVGTHATRGLAALRNTLGDSSG